MARDGDRRDQEIEQFKYLLRQERATTDYLNDVVDGLNYELHQPDLRLGEKDRYIKQNF